VLHDLLFRLQTLFRRRSVDSELDDELRFHFERQVAKYLKSGNEGGGSRAFALGLAGAIALTRVMVSLLFEVKPTDPPTLIGVALLLAAVALLACYIPARHALNIHPMTALRCE